jgi:catalase
MRVDGNLSSTLAYEPDCCGKWQEQPEFKEPPLSPEGAADHWNAREDDDDYYTQPGLLFSLMSPEQQQVLFENTAHTWPMPPKKSRSGISATASRLTKLIARVSPMPWHKAELSTQIKLSLV